MLVIFVCTGNTCRSPMAEGYLKSQNIYGLNVESRGLFTDGSPACVNSRIATSELDIDISEHISKQFTSADLSADLIICLSQNHLDMLLSAGADKNRLMLLGNGISDPYGQNTDVYRRTLQEIIKEVDILIDSGTFSEFSIRKIGFDDAAVIARIETECFSEPWSENAIKEALDAGNTFFAAENNGNIIGYIGISTVLDEGYINNIAVTADFRLRGAASLLLNKIVRFARDKKLSFISLEVRASNKAALTLYRSFKFEDAGIRRGFYRNPTEDAVIMTRRFDHFNEDTKH